MLLGFLAHQPIDHPLVNANPSGQLRLAQPLLGEDCLEIAAEVLD